MASDKKKLYLSQLIANDLVDFDKVKHFFLYEGRHIVYIDENEKYNKVFFKGDNALKEFLDAWKRWHKTLRKNPSQKIFEYPLLTLFRETREYVSLDFFLKLGFIFLLLIICTSGLSRAIRITPQILLVLFLFLFGVSLLDALLMRYTKRFFKIVIEDDNTLHVSFLNGRFCSFSFAMVKEYYLGIKSKNAHLVFSDGTILQHLERVSHWPLLREYLLSKLETTHKNESK